jgi:triacylglycerol esterase/lipase EstA (alpha/beta hydrolase family)
VSHRLRNGAKDALQKKEKLRQTVKPVTCQLEEEMARIKANDGLELSPNGRIHIILVPGFAGFAGFDVLGQLEYYAGVTPLFRRRQKTHQDRATVVLHYFDKFPTAAVATRSELLGQYLVKRIARGGFANDDRIALVGHSTGGLDIRFLLRRLAQMSKPILTDGGKKEAVEVNPLEVLELVDRVCLSLYLSGTPILPIGSESIASSAKSWLP